MTAVWPRQYPAPAARAALKTVPEDFHVVELPDLDQSPAAADGAGEHLFLRLEKRGLTTTDVAAWLAQSYRVPEAAVGYAGMKDKHALTEQWFSVHTTLDADALPARPGVRLCAATRRIRKLRRGQLTGNRFRVRLRNVAGDAWRERLESLAAHGAPNYFGPQRFGGDNLDRARYWLAGRPRRRSRDFRRGLHLSVLRSFLFNEVLGLRVANGTWNALVPGDVAAALPALSDVGEPCRIPTGPLWGRGRSPASGDCLEMEQTALAPHGDVRNGLEHAGLVHARRALMVRPEALGWQAKGSDVEIRFALPAGCYATTLLAEAFDLEPGTAP